MLKYQDLVSAISVELDVSKKAVDDVIKKFSSVVQREVLENGKDVSVPSFGRFIQRKVNAVTDRKIGNFTVDIKENTKVAFRPFEASYGEK